MLERAAHLTPARTLVVNMLIVSEIAYLFNVRFLHMRSLTLRGAMGTPAVLLAIAVVVLAQLAFTYLPVMNWLFDSKPLSLTHGLAIIGVGAAVLLFLEGEKLLMRKLGVFKELGTRSEEQTSELKSLMRNSY